MNIFASDECPRKSAINLDDKRVVKMCLESAQIICTTADYYGLAAPYKPTHTNHPACVWVRQSQGNWNWFFTHTLSLFEEYTYRYAKVHLSHTKVIHDSNINLEAIRLALPKGPRYAWPSSIGSSINGCRVRLINKWINDIKSPTWTHRSPPSWFTEDTYLGIG